MRVTLATIIRTREPVTGLNKLTLLPCGEDLFFLLAANVCDVIINATSVIVNNAHRNNSGFISAICITPERLKKLSKVSGKSEKSQSCTQHVSLHPLQNTGRL